MGNTSLIENRVSKLEVLTNKIAKANGITNEVLSELVCSVSDEVKYQVKEEIALQSKGMETNIVNNINNGIDEKIKKAVDEKGLNRKESKILTATRNARLYQLLGRGDKYTLYIRYYQNALVKSYREKFECCAYADVNASEFDNAIEFINNFDVTDRYFEWMTKVIHESYKNGEMSSLKTRHAYERYFGLNKIVS